MRPSGNRSERALLHPLWVTALILLIANDHFFKGAGILHHIATGKLSDVAGLIVAPMLLAALLRARSREAIAACHWATGVVFCLVQVSPAFAFHLETLMGSLGVPWRLWPDLTDLLTLPSLLVSWRVLVPATEDRVSSAERAHQLGRLAAATVGLLACVGTSAQPATPPEVPEAPPPVVAATPQIEPSRDLTALVGYAWRATNDDGTWQLTYHFRADGTYRASGRPAWQEVGKVEILDADAHRMVLRLYDRVFDGSVDEPLERELTFAPDGRSFELDGDRYERIERVANIAVTDEDEGDPVP